LVHRALQARRVQLVQKAIRETKDQKVIQEIQVLRVQLVHKDPREILGRKEIKAYREIKVRLDLLVHKV